MSQEPRNPAESGARDVRAQSPSSVIERLRAKGARGERYGSREEIARGGMGVVVRVWDGDLQRHLAMKVMLAAEKEHSGSASAASSEGRRVARFLDEAHITGQLDHPGIVPVHEIGLDPNGQLFFTMRLVKGRELREVFELVPTATDGWTLARALGVILKVCEAMAFAHEKGVIHRDLKPANVMVGRFGEVYVMDWGLAKVLGREDAHDIRLAKPEVSQTIVRSARSEMSGTPESPLSTMDGDIVGTPCYMAPEQARGRLEDIGPQSDVYSVGAMLYELLGGEKPYCVGGAQPTPSAVLGALMHGPPRALTSIKKGLPDELVAICEKAMARDVRERYASMLGMAEDLRAFLEGRVVQAYETGPIAEFKKWIARNKAFAGAVAAAFLIALIGAFVALSLQLQANTELRAANSVIEDRNRNLQEQERQTRSAYDQLAEAIDEQGRVNRALQAMTAQAQSSAALAQRRGYAASVAAADGSLRLHDIKTAQRLLEEGCEAELRGWEWRYLRSRCDDSVKTLEVANSPLEAMATSRDGRWIAYAVEQDKQHILRMIDAATGELVREFPENDAFALALSFDPSGARLACLSFERKVLVFDVERGTLVSTWSERASVAPNLEFTPDGAQLLLATSDESASLRDCSTGSIVREFSGLPKRVVRLRLSADGARFAAASRDGTIAIFSTERGERERTLEPRGGPIFALDFDDAGARLLVAGGHSRDESGAPLSEFDRALYLWSLDDGTLLRTFVGHDDRVLWCGFGSDGRKLVSVAADRSIRVWDIDSGASDARLGHAATITAAARLGDGDRIVTADAAGQLRAWDWTAGASLDIDDMRRNVALLAFSHDGRVLVGATHEGELRAWDTRSGFPRWVRDDLLKNQSTFTRVRALAASPKRAQLAIATNQGLTRVFDSDSGERLGEFSEDGPSAVTALAYSHDGLRLAAATSIGIVRVYLASTLALECSLLTGESISAIAWSSDDRSLVVGTLHGAVQAWNVADETHVDLSRVEGRSIVALAVDRASGRLLVRSGDEIELWSQPDADANRVTLPSFPGDDVAFLDEGRRFISRSARGVVSIHDSERLEPLLTLRRDASGASALAAAGDGAVLAAGFPDGLVRLWFATPASERYEFKRAALRARELALPLVEELFAGELDCDAAIAGLRANEAISEPLRDAALDLVRLCAPRAEFLLQESRGRAAMRSLPAADYRLAICQARMARKLEPDDHRGLVVEGALAYRLRDFERAGELLRQALQLQTQRRFEPEIAGYLTLCELARGRVQEAQAPYAEFRSLMTTIAINARNLENAELAREVEQAMARTQPR